MPETFGLEGKPIVGPADRERVFDEPQWFGVTLMGDYRLCFAAHAHSEDDALDLVAQAMGKKDKTELLIHITSLHDRNSQRDLMTTYPNESVVHVLPFSIERYPEPDQVELSHGQIEAMEKFHPGWSEAFLNRQLSST